MRSMILVSTKATSRAPTHLRLHLVLFVMPANFRVVVVVVSVVVLFIHTILLVPRLGSGLPSRGIRKHGRWIASRRGTNGDPFIIILYSSSRAGNILPRKFCRRVSMVVVYRWINTPLVVGTRERI